MCQTRFFFLGFCCSNFVNLFPVFGSGYYCFSFLACLLLCLLSLCFSGDLEPVWFSSSSNSKNTSVLLSGGVSFSKSLEPRAPVCILQYCIFVGA